MGISVRRSEGTGCGEQVTDVALPTKRQVTDGCAYRGGHDRPLRFQGGLASHGYLYVSKNERNVARGFKKRCVVVVQSRTRSRSVSFIFPLSLQSHRAEVSYQPPPQLVRRSQRALWTGIRETEQLNKKQEIKRWMGWNGVSEGSGVQGREGRRTILRSGGWNWLRHPLGLSSVDHRGVTSALARPTGVKSFNLQNTNETTTTTTSGPSSGHVAVQNPDRSVG
jgi:hypothetical protein